MSPDEEKFLNLRRLPAQLEPEQAAWYLGFHAHDIPILMAAGFLRPLGHPAANAPKYFSTVELEQLYRDPKTLNRARGAVRAHWRKRKGREHLKPFDEANEADKTLLSNRS